MLLMIENLNYGVLGFWGAIRNCFLRIYFVQLRIAHPLPQPFFVLATRNPSAGGTYPLPEGRLDRFMALLRVDYRHE